MQRVTRKVICALLSLLLVMGGQVVMGAQEMPSGAISSGMAESMADCGHPNGGSPGDYATATAAPSDCAKADNVACTGSPGSAHCVMTMVFAHNPAFSLAEANSGLVIPGALFFYQSPFLDVLTPPPDSLS